MNQWATSRAVLIFCPVRRKKTEQNLGIELKNHFPLGIVSARDRNQVIKEATQDTCGILFNLFKCNFNVLPTFAEFFYKKLSKATSEENTRTIKEILNITGLKDNVTFFRLVRGLILVSPSIDIMTLETADQKALCLEQALCHPMFPNGTGNMGSYCHRLIANESWYKVRRLFDYFLSNKIFNSSLKDQLETTVLAMLCKFKAPTPLIQTYFELCAKIGIDTMVNEPDKEGWRPLDWAILYGAGDIVKLLLQHNANPFPITSSQKTPLDSLILSKEDYEKSLRNALNNAELFPDRLLALPTNYFLGFVDEDKQRIPNTAENLSCLKEHAESTTTFTYQSYEGYHKVSVNDLLQRGKISLISSLMQARDDSSKIIINHLLNYLIHPISERILRDPNPILPKKPSTIRIFNNMEFWVNYLKKLLEQETDCLVDSYDWKQSPSNGEAALDFTFKLIKKTTPEEISTQLSELTDKQLEYCISQLSTLFTNLLKSRPKSKENPNMLSIELLVILGLCDYYNRSSLQESKDSLTSFSTTQSFWSGKIPASTSESQMPAQPAPPPTQNFS